MSDYLKKLRASLASKSGELEAIMKKATDEDGRELTEEEMKKVDELSADVDRLTKSIEAAQKAEKARGLAAAPASAEIGDEAELKDTEIEKTPAQPATKMKLTTRVGLISMAIVEAEFQRRELSEPVSALKILEQRGFARLAKAIDVERRRKVEFIKALNASTNISGGFLTPDTKAAEIIELLYPETTFLQGNPRRVNMPNGTYRQPAGATGSSASYRQEGGEIVTTEPTFREVSMSTKFLGAIVPMTREMIDFSEGGAQNFVETDLREAMSVEMDAKAYFGAGSGGEPEGLTVRTGITTVTVQGTTAPTLAQVDNTFKALRLALFNRNIRNMGRWRYVMAPRTLEHLQNMRVGDSDGQFAYPETRGDSPRMGSIPILVSTQVPINLGDGADESLILLVNFADTLLGTQGEIAMATSSEASVKINGTMVSAFQHNLVLLRAISGHDIGLRRPESIVYCPAVQWGA